MRPGEERHGTAPVRPDPANVGEVRGVSAETDIRDGPGRVGPVFHTPRSHAVVEVPAAIGCGRVDKDDGVAPIEFLKHRLVGGVTQPGVAKAGHEADPIGVDLIVGVRDLLQCGIDVG